LRPETSSFPRKKKTGRERMKKMREGIRKGVAVLQKKWVRGWMRR
jgi:hypothetical protein